MIVVLLLWMVILALSQLLGRWIFDYGMPWVDQQLRQLVLWVGLMGGMLAAADDRHIRIDLVEHYLPQSAKLIVKKIINLIAAAINALLCCIAIGFVGSEKQSNVLLEDMFFNFDIPIWISELIIPFGFGMMSIFFILHAFKRASSNILE